MSEVVTAVYENGILRPAHPLNLREKQQVRIQVWTEEGQDAVEQVIQELIDARLLPPLPVIQKESQCWLQNAVSWPKRSAVFLAPPCPRSSSKSGANNGRLFCRQ